MADIIDRRPGGGGAKGDSTRYHDEGDGSYSEATAAKLRIYDATDGAWNKATADHTTGGLKVYVAGQAGGGGSAVSVADGSDVAEGTTSDVAYVSGSGTVISILKAIFSKLSGSLAVTGTFWQATQPVSGTFWQATQPVSGTFFQATQPVSGTVTSNQGTAGSPWPAYTTTDLLYNATTALTPKWATITASSSGAQTQITAVTSKKLRVLALSLIASGTVNVKFQSHTAGDKTGLFYLVANTGFVLPPNQYGWFETVAGEALDINLSGATAVGGVLQYVEV